MRIPIDWDAERLDAHAILGSLVADFQETEAAHSGLLKSWPERPDQVSVDVSSYSASCVPELDLRQAEGNPFVFLRRLILESMSALLKACTGARGVDPEPSDRSHFETMLCIAKLSGRGVAEAVPYLLPKLQRKALISIHSFLLDGKKIDIRNRSHLLKAVEEDLLQGSYGAELVGGRRTQNGTPTQKLLEILKSQDSYKSEEEFSKGRVSLLGSPRSPKAAAIEALMQLDSLPLTSLHVMLEALRGKIPDAKIGKLPTGASKNRLSNIIMSIGTALLSDTKDEDPLPETLRKALVVMSLSARHTSGDDGKLIEHLGPHPRKIRTRQRRLLYCLSRLKLLSKDDVAALLEDLAESPDVLPIAQQKKPGSLRTILLDCLLRSEVRRIPKVVRRTLKRIRKIVRRDPETKAKEETVREKKLARVEFEEFREVRTGVELEATLRVSTHLQQIVRDSLPETRDWNERRTRRSCSRKGRKGVARPDLEERIISACDRTAGVGYSLVGCAIEGMIRYTAMSQNSNFSVTEYLRSGSETFAKGKGSELVSQSPAIGHDQVTFILNSAESFLGPSVLSRVRIRLGQI